MLRKLHKLLGLAAALLIVATALSGTLLSVVPALERATVPTLPEPGMSVAALAEKIAAALPSVEQIRRAPSGRITAYALDQGRDIAVVIDLGTGVAVAPYTPSAYVRWLTDLHRALFLGNAGRLVTAAGALSLLVLSLSGLWITARRLGGWRRFFTRLSGPLSSRIHVEAARLAAPGLFLSAVTGLFMTAGTFNLISGSPAPGFPAEVSGQTGARLSDMPLLRDTAAGELRELTLPIPGRGRDVVTLRTSQGSGYIDQGTGATLSWASLGPWQRLSEAVYMLHTGQGAWLLGLFLGLAALAVPVMAVTGLILSAQRLRRAPRIRGNARPGQADTIILVGSESGSTWGFATTLHAALRAAGHEVHAAPMSAFIPARYERAQRLLILAATYGNGDAPTSAKGFLERLTALPAAPGFPLAILGFGDRSFPDFCEYARAVADAAEALGWPTLLPPDSVNRQSAQDFARWGRTLGAALGHEIELRHYPRPPRSVALQLVSRRDYGAEMLAPVAILRFALPRPGLKAQFSGRAIPRFAAGDLLGVIPEGDTLPRLYSLASSRADGFIEICVRACPGGLCSGQLLALTPGDSIRAFVRRNREFRPAAGRRPVILIGAGSGIGPLAGFIRANHVRRPMHLYFGARHPASDFLYGEELGAWQADGRLSTLASAFSRAPTRHYVQDALRRDAGRILQLLDQGAHILVCGGRDMAAGVSTALTEILAPRGLALATLKMEGRYVEDVY
ncbi:MAG: N-acetylglucosamine transferase [Rhodobacteraceae bacterium]|nr:N-acetylglucosamine transferase [Paracoccaceae bacterium]